MRRRLVITFSTLAAILLVAVAVFYYLLHDQDWIKGKVEGTVSELSGRQFTIQGPLDIEISLHPTVAAEGLMFANAPWADTGNMVELNKLRLSIDLLSVFSDQFVIHFIEADGLVVALAENDNGDVNWDLFPGEKTEDEAALTEWPINLGRVSLTQFSMTHDAPDRTEPLDLVIAEFQAVKLEDERVELIGNGSIGGLPLSLDGLAGPLNHLILGGGMDVKTDIHLGEIDLNIEGHVVDVLTGEGMDMRVNFSGPEFTWLTRRFALEDFSSGPFDFDFQLENLEDSTKIDLVGDLGSLDINAKGTVDDPVSPREGEVQFDITGPNLKALVNALGGPELPQSPYRVQGDVSTHLGETRIQDLQIELGENTGQLSGTLGEWPELLGSELELVFQGSDLSQWGPLLGLDDLAARPFDLSGRFSNRDSGAILTTVRFESNDSYAEFSGSLGQAPEFVGADLQIDIMTPDLASIAVLSTYADLPAFPLRVQGGVGRSEAAVLLNNIKVELGGDQLILDGHIATVEKFYGSELKLSANVKSVAQLGHLFDAHNLPDFPATLNADMGWSENGLKWVSKDGRFGDLDVSLDGNLSQPQAFDGAAFTFQFAVPNLQQLPVEMDLQNLPALPARIDGHVEYRGKTIDLSKVKGAVGDAGFEFDARLTGQEKYVGSYLDFRFSGPDLRGLFAGKYPSLPASEFKASGKIALGSDADQITGLKLELGDLSATVDGTVDDLTQITSANVTASVSGPDLSHFDSFTERDLPELPFSLNASISGTGQVFSLNPFQVNLGPSDLTGDLSVDLQDNPVIHGKIRSKYLDIAWLSSPDEEEPEETTESATASADQRVFPDTEIPAFGLGGAEMDLDLAAERLRLKATELDGVVLKLTLYEELLRVDHFEFGGPLGEKVFGRLEFGGSQDSVDLEFIMDARDFRLGLSAAEGQDPDTFPPTDININVNGSGATYHELASSLNGRFRVVQKKGQIANAGLDLIFSDLLSELFATLNPFAKKSEYTNLECALINADISSGIVLLKPFIFQTEQLTIFSGGQIDLVTEKISLDFETKLRKGIGLSAGMAINPFIQLGGNLSSPGIELDPAGVAVTGGVAIATAGLSLVGKSLWDRFLTSKEPCKKALERLEKEDAEKQ